MTFYMIRSSAEGSLIHKTVEINEKVWGLYRDYSAVNVANAYTLAMISGWVLTGIADFFFFIFSVVVS